MRRSTLLALVHSRARLFGVLEDSGIVLTSEELDAFGFNARC